MWGRGRHKGHGGRAHSRAGRCAFGCRSLRLSTGNRRGAGIRMRSGKVPYDHWRTRTSGQGGHLQRGRQAADGIWARKQPNLCGSKRRGPKRRRFACDGRLDVSGTRGDRLVVPGRATLGPARDYAISDRMVGEEKGTATLRGNAHREECFLYARKYRGKEPWEKSLRRAPEPVRQRWPWKPGGIKDKAVAGSSVAEN